LSRPIGVIDSGVGGLTVAKEIMRQLPKEQIMYIGDTARCPYGPRPSEEVRAFTWEMTNYLIAKDIKMLSHFPCESSYFFTRTGTVWAAGCISNVHNLFFRKLSHNFLCYR
jgi:hypothetical protein